MTKPYADRLRSLSPRERQVFNMIVWGYSNAAMANAAGISIKTIDTHRARINRKMGCSTGLALLREGVLAGALTAADLAPPAIAGMATGNILGIHRDPIKPEF